MTEIEKWNPAVHCIHGLRVTSCGSRTKFIFRAISFYVQLEKAKH